MNRLFVLIPFLAHLSCGAEETKNERTQEPQTEANGEDTAQGTTTDSGAPTDDTGDAPPEDDTGEKKPPDTGQDTGTKPVDDRIWPGEFWDEADPSDQGMDAKAVEAAAAYAFTEGFNTQSLVIIKDGVLVGEWYVDGTDQDTPVTSWSMAKSVTSALYGVALREGVLSLDDTIGTYVLDWAKGANADRTIRHMLEMQSGLPANNSSVYGVYFAPDQLAYSLERSPLMDQGEAFVYVNEDSMVLGEVLTQAFSEPVEQVAQREILQPIGMDALWWTDSVGNTLTYCCMDSTARDFARFGLLYARDGLWQSDQLIPAEFVFESTTGISYYGYYGLHWWTYEAYFAAIGYHGQYLIVYPEHDLVVARFGLYERVGKVPVVTPYSYHSTWDSFDFSSSTLMDLVLASFAESEKKPIKKKD